MAGELYTYGVLSAKQLEEIKTSNNKSELLFRALELANKEGGVEIIQRKIAEDAALVRDLRVVPPSLKKDAGYIKKASDLGLF